MANAVSGHQIRVNGINLGWTDTPAEDYIQKNFIMQKTIIKKLKESSFQKIKQTY